MSALERAFAIRANNAFKIVHEINDEFRGRGLEQFDVDKEIKYA